MRNDRPDTLPRTRPLRLLCGPLPAFMNASFRWEKIAPWILHTPTLRRTVVGDFLATTDDSGELKDTFRLFGDDAIDGTDGAAVGGDAGSAEEGADGSTAEGGNRAGGPGAGSGHSVAKLKTLDAEAFRSCLVMCFEHMVSKGLSDRRMRAGIRGGCQTLRV